VFDTLVDDLEDGSSSVVERRMRILLAERAGAAVVQTFPPPCAVVVDLETRRSARAARLLDPRVRLLEAGAGHLDAVADLERVMAQAAAAQVRELASFARCRPSSWDRQPGERGAASSTSRAARPAVLAPVSEWAAAEVAARLRLPRRAAESRLAEAVFLVEQLPATLAALETGAITAAHAHALVDLLEPVSNDARGFVEAAALERAGTQTVDTMRSRVRRLIARHDAAAALRRLVAAAKSRAVALYGDDDGMATLAARVPGPVARACHEALTGYAQACEFDEDGNRDPRSLDERRADSLADLILRPHGDRPAVQIALTVVAGVGTLTGLGPGADEPGEVDGDLVPAPFVRELAYTFGLMPRPTATPAPVSVTDEPGIDGDPDDRVSVDWSQTAPGPGDAGLEERIAALEAEEKAAAADLAAAIDAEDRIAGSDSEPAGRDPVPRMAAVRAQRQAALQRLLAAHRLTGTALAHRPHIALVDQLSGTLLALTDTVALRQAATAGLGLGPPPATDAYQPTDPLARFVKLRDRRCRFPGCRARARCADLDHQTPHPHGPTAHDNLACLCEFHHRLSHQGPGWRLRRDENGGLVWTLPGGHTVTTYPPAVGTDDAPATVTGPPPDARVHRRRTTNPTLEALRGWRPRGTAAHPDIPF
jgi:hypothetical protein